MPKLNDAWLVKTDFIRIDEEGVFRMQACVCGNFGDDGPDDWCPQIDQPGGCQHEDSM